MCTRAMIDFYLVVWWLNEIAYPLAVIAAVLVWVGGFVKDRIGK